MNYFILGVFILTYIFLISGKVNKLWIVGVSSGLLIFTRTVSLDQAFSFINWNVLSIFVGMLILADMFIDSRVPAYLARNLASKAKTTALAVASGRCAHHLWNEVGQPFGAFCFLRSDSKLMAFSGSATSMSFLRAIMRALQLGPAARRTRSSRSPH